MGMVPKDIFPCLNEQCNNARGSAVKCNEYSSKSACSLAAATCYWSDTFDACNAKGTTRTYLSDVSTVSAVSDATFLQSSVTLLPYAGAASYMYMHGPNVTSIFADSDNRTVMAAGEMGNGRFCVFSHGTISLI